MSHCMHFSKDQQSFVKHNFYTPFTEISMSSNKSFSRVWYKSIIFVTLFGFQCIPVSQLVPSYPAVQVHEYWFTWSTQVAPFMQGSLAHSSVSRKQQTGVISFLNWIMVPRVPYIIRINNLGLVLCFSVNPGIFQKDWVNYSDVIMSTMAFFNHHRLDCVLKRSGADQRKHWSRASLEMT